MLQIDHIYNFLYKNIFFDLEVWNLPGGITKSKDVSIIDVHVVFNPEKFTTKKIFIYDQEPLIPEITNDYLKLFTWVPNWKNLDDLEELKSLNNPIDSPIGVVSDELVLEAFKNPEIAFKQKILCTSEKSKLFDDYVKQHDMKKLYYFFHGFASLDWYRSYYALNYNKPIIKKYDKDFVSYNRIISNDRSYRIYLISLLEEYGLLDKGLVSFGVTDDSFNDWRDELSNPDTKLSNHAQQHIENHLTDINKLIIDNESLPGSASADIPDVDAFWHIVTETVFYYDKLHLTEKIFKPIVSKQPFMLLAAPGNLEYLRSYGFKTFDRWIDESYDTITDPDKRIEAVVEQLKWWSNLSDSKKYSKMCAMENTIEYNFDHFYNKFNEIIVDELLENCKTLFKEINYNDNQIKYNDIRHTLTFK